MHWEQSFSSKYLRLNSMVGLIIFKTRQEKWLEKMVIGKEKNEIDNVL